MSDSPIPVTSDQSAPEHLNLDNGAEAPAITTESNTAPAARQRSALREIIETILIAALIFVVVRALVLNFRVDGHSMDTTLQDGEMLLVNRNSYASFDLNNLLDALPFVERDEENEIYIFDDPDRGDIIVFDPPQASSKPYIKRIVGLPGETVAIENGNVYVDGEVLEEPYVEAGATDCGKDKCEWTVPEDFLFVMGDNRRNSSDSRSFGPIAVNSVVGKAAVTYWPMDELHLLLGQDYPDD